MITCEFSALCEYSERVRPSNGGRPGDFERLEVGKRGQEERLGTFFRTRYLQGWGLLFTRFHTAGRASPKADPAAAVHLATSKKLPNAPRAFFNPARYNRRPNCANRYEATVPRTTQRARSRMDTRNAGPVTKDDAYDVSDPTDWLGTPLASLMPVEQSLRCHVCKDFFNSPMVTSCCHTFCSLCIRRALASDGKCPLCRATDQESRLRGNWAIREAVESFIRGRDAMLRLAREPQASATDAPAQTPKRKADDGTQDGGYNSKRTRMSTRSSSARAAEATSAMMREEAGEPEVEEIEAEEYRPSRLLRPPPPHPAPSRTAECWRLTQKK